MDDTGENDGAPEADKRKGKIEPQVPSDVEILGSKSAQLVPVCVRDGSGVQRVCRSGQSSSVVEDENFLKLFLRKSLRADFWEWVSNFLTRRVEEISPRLTLLRGTILLSALEQ